MVRLFAYVRVSTAKQGTQGVSLAEQRDAISQYARRNELKILAWFEEKETAAKRGRPVFGDMLRELRKGKAEGVVIHKIDRSARNLKDWADLGELIDAGVAVYFAAESLDLQSRGGRLSADIQAVVAADFIRNLREETKKGFYGRLKQGLYPMPAPLGYLDRGKGKSKEPDPATADFIRQAFELYATGEYTLATLGNELHRRGLRNKKAGRVTKNGLSVLLHNPFYTGLIRLWTTGETFEGVHPPLVSRSTFDQVQRILAGKPNPGPWRHRYLFRRLFRCANCGYSLIGERQKGHIYYRCHTANCPTTGVREEEIADRVATTLQPFQLSDRDWAYLEHRLQGLEKRSHDERGNRLQSLRLRQSRNKARVARLTDAYIDRVIGKEIFEERKEALLRERQEVRDELRAETENPTRLADDIREKLELSRLAYLSYKQGNDTEKRRMIEILTSNRVVEGKTPTISLASPFDVIAYHLEFQDGTPQRDRHRILGGLFDQLCNMHLPMSNMTKAGRQEGEVAA